MCSPQGCLYIVYISAGAETKLEASMRISNPWRCGNLPPHHAQMRINQAAKVTSQLIIIFQGPMGPSTASLPSTLRNRKWLLLTALPSGSITQWRAHSETIGKGQLLWSLSYKNISKDIHSRLENNVLPLAGRLVSHTNKSLPTCSLWPSTLKGVLNSAVYPAMVSLNHGWKNMSPLKNKLPKNIKLTNTR